MSFYFEGKEIMAYDYNTEKPKILTDEGQRTFIKVRDEAMRLLREAGAFEMFKPLKGVTGDNWTAMAYIDRMVEIGDIREVPQSGIAAQDRVFVKA